MKHVKNKRAIIVGLFIFFAIAIFIAGVFTLGGQRKAFGKSLTLRAVFDDVSGLKVGDNVWLSGVKIGTVKKISFTEDLRVEVFMTIDREVQHLIRHGAKAKISSEGFIGNKLIVIYGGKNADQQIANNQLLDVEKYVTTDEMMATLQANNQNLLVITQNLKTLSSEIITGKGAISALLHDSSIVTSLRSTLNNFDGTAKNSRRLIASLNNFSSQLNEFSAKLNQNGTLVNDLLTDTTVFNSIRGTVSLIRESAYNASELSNSLKDASYELYNKNSPAGVLLKDSAVANDLRITIKNLQSSSQKLDENLEALQHNFLLKGYFKKKEKNAVKDSAR